MAVAHSKPSPTNSPKLQKTTSGENTVDTNKGVIMDASATAASTTTKEEVPITGIPVTSTATVSKDEDVVPKEESSKVDTDVVVNKSLVGIKEKGDESAPKTTTIEPTYQSVQETEAFLLAKRQLNEDQFEVALEIIEGCIQKNEKTLQYLQIPQDDIALHESMAPFHYLYGTTLLYNIEESSDNQQMTTIAGEKPAASAVTVAAAAAGAVLPEEQAHAAAAAAAGLVDNDGDNDPALISKDSIDEGAAAALAVATASASASAHTDNNFVPADVAADEMEIAWENLEIARSIVERMMVKTKGSSSSSSSSNNADNDDKQVQLDLAQIYLREGDLQRMNGRYENAIQDYSSCLQLRTQKDSAIIVMNPYDRKIADTHYNMALTYMLQCAEPDKDNNTTNNGAEEDADIKNDSKKQKRSADEDSYKRIMSRNRGVYHYLECAKCLCGQIVSMCDNKANPTDVVEVKEDDFKKEADDDEKKAGLKSTGEDEKMMMMNPNTGSSILQVLRKRVEKMKANTDDDQAIVDDLRQLLDEIQETVDEAENSAKGVQEVSEMKAAVAAAAAGGGDSVSDENPFTSNNKPTTTIGFGTAAATAAAVVAAASTEQQQQQQKPPVVMMVKKKEKT